jgi:uncharacterized tellurite resistance protein B-like protein
VSILKFLGFGEAGGGPGAAPTAESESVREIIRTLDRLEPDRARFLAAFAYILGRVARADLVISEAESGEMERLLVQQGGLAPEQAILVVQMAKSQHELFGGTENYLVTREFNRIATQDQKLALLQCLFSVSASDEWISLVEDNEIRRIASELKITHGDYIKSRSAWRDQLAILKKQP